MVNERKFLMWYGVVHAEVIVNRLKLAYCFVDGRDAGSGEGLLWQLKIVLVMVLEFDVDVCG